MRPILLSLPRFVRRPVAQLRRAMRRHRIVFAILRLASLFMAAFGGAYGFISASITKDAGYDPHAFAIGASFLFALACCAIATMSLRMRLLRKSMRVLAVHNDALADRNWELKEAEHHARSLFEQQSDLVVLYDEQNVITQVNDAYCAATGRPRAELIGASFPIGVIDQGDILQSGGTRAHDQKLATARGPRWIAWREARLRRDAGHPVEWQCVGRDVTEQRDAERGLIAARDRADDANRAKSRFLAMASHEIRTPLNGILGMSGLLLDSPLTAEQATYARAVRTSGDALLVLIEELLDDAKLEAGRLTLDERPFALIPLVEEVTELLAPRAQARGLEIAADVDERLPAVLLGDAARLRQILLNLAGNAIKFTVDGGVSISVAPGADDSELALCVRDTGIGIAAEARERIFGEYEQATADTVRSYGGSGLGLSITERIVKRMGGRVTFDSTPGVGTLFTVILPMIVSPDMDAAQTVAPDLAGQTILLVARKPLGAQLIAQRCERWGAQVTIVSDPAIAEALLPERAWTTLLIDHDASDDAGTRLAETAAAHTVRRIVMLTPAARAADGIGPHYTGYLMKPLRAASLAARLIGEAMPREQIAGEAVVQVGPPAAPRRAGGRAILVAEDNEINAMLIDALLKRLGHDVLVVGDGAAARDAYALASANDRPYDLVLMDLQMPGLDGIAATTAIRAMEAGGHKPRTPIVALTANTLDEDRDAAASAGMDDFLVKPLDRDRLEAVLARFAGLDEVVAA